MNESVDQSVSTKRPLPPDAAPNSQPQRLHRMHTLANGLVSDVLEEHRPAQSVDRGISIKEETPKPPARLNGSSDSDSDSASDPGPNPASVDSDISAASRSPPNSSDDDDSDDEEANMLLIAFSIPLNTGKPLTEAELRAPVLQTTPKNDPFNIASTVSLQESIDMKTCLRKDGVPTFIDRYLSSKSRYSIPQLLIGLGFLPSAPLLMDDSDNGEHKLLRTLRFAIRHTLTFRERVPQYSNLLTMLNKIRQAERIMVLTGAGISTSLGIPDFRSKKGLYNKYQYLKLSDPQEIFDIQQFRDDPRVFYHVARDILPAPDIYTPTHAFIRLLQDKGKLLRNYTQNIDNIEANAGISPDKLVHCHGSFATATCQTCGYTCPGSDLYEEIRAGEVARCPECRERREERKKNRGNRSGNGNGNGSRSSFVNGRNSYNSEDSESDFDDLEEFYGIMKPDITFFGEDLCQEYHQNIRKDRAECDLLLCIGTSLKVSPVSDITHMVPREIPQIYINRDTAKHTEFDVTLLGNCDDVVQWLCLQLGWDLQHKMLRKEPPAVEDMGDGVYKVVELPEKPKAEEPEAPTPADSSRGSSAASGGSGGSSDILGQDGDPTDGGSSD